MLRSLAPGEEIGEEVPKDRDQFFRVEKGKVEVWIDSVRTKIKGDDAIEALHAYGPPNHRDGFAAATKSRSRGIEGTFWRQDHRTTGR